MLNSNREAQTNKTFVVSVAGRRELLLLDDVGRFVDGVIVVDELMRVRSGDSLGGMAEEKMPLKRCELGSAE